MLFYEIDPKVEQMITFGERFLVPVAICLLAAGGIVLMIWMMLNDVKDKKIDDLQADNDKKDEIIKRIRDVLNKTCEKRCNDAYEIIELEESVREANARADQNNSRAEKWAGEAEKMRREIETAA